MFFFARNELIRREAFIIEFELLYLLICNLAPLAIMIRVIILFRRINDLNELYGAKLDES